MTSFDQLQAQYRQTALAELHAIGLSRGGPVTCHALDGLVRISEMAHALRHRRTAYLLDIALDVARAEIAGDAEPVPSGLWERTDRALERLISGGRPDPQVARELATSLGSDC